MALILYRPIFWILAGVILLALVGLARWTRLRWWPAWLTRLLLVGLALLVIFTPHSLQEQRAAPQRQVMVVDQSDSLSSETRMQLQQQALAWRDAQPGRILLSFDSQVHPVVGASWYSVNDENESLSSNLADAIDQADQLLGSGAGEVILVSDGLAADPPAAEAAVRRLAKNQHRLQVVPVAPRQDAADGYVGQLSAPNIAWEGIPFDVILPVYPPSGDSDTNLEVRINEQVVELSPRKIEGSQAYLLHVPGQSQGIVTLAVKASFENDPFLLNNQAFAVLRVYTPPKVLFITSQPDKVQEFTYALSSYGLDVAVKPPQELPNDTTGLADYKVVFLHNLLASQLTDAQMLTLQTFTARQAGGVVFLGGRYSYTLGGYQNTLLESMLPVKLEPPPRSERPPMTMLLMLDISGSMGVPIKENDSLTPIDLERESAMRVVETLKPDDVLGVLTYSTDFYWEVGLRPLGAGLSLRQALDVISQIRSYTGTDMYAAMQEAVSKLNALPSTAPESRYMLVLSDGKSFDGSLAEFEDLTRLANLQGITISTIALGTEIDREVMSAIAKEGKGRYYEVSDVNDLPRIMFAESQAARSENIQEGQTTLKEGEPQHPVLSGMSTRQLPELKGYNAIGSKADQGAEDILVSASFGDPILSAWQYGLGRVVAWMGDIGEEWSGAWQSEALEGQFWSQVIRYALPNPALDQAQVEVRAGDTDLKVDASIQAGTDNPSGMYQVTFSYADSAGKVRTFYVPQSGASVYHVDLSRPEDGAYRAVLAYQAGSGAAVEVPAPFAVSPPEEWLPGSAAEGYANLVAWAALANGQVITLESVMSAAVPVNTQVKQPEINPAWLLLALLVLWPLDILLRRRWMPWQ
jgi:Ca-activated chloride channel family protein